MTVFGRSEWLYETNNIYLQFKIDKYKLLVEHIKWNNIARLHKNSYVKFEK